MIMPKYLVWDAPNLEAVFFNDIEDARKYIEGCFFSNGYYADVNEIEQCGIFELKVGVKVDTSKESEGIWSHEFVNVKSE
jgi:DNA-binding transcriptional regulator WhiA